MQEFRKTLFGLICLFVVLIIIGCGSSGEDPSNVGVEENPYSISVTLLDSAGNETRTVSDENPGKLRITVKNSSGSLVANQFLTVTTTKGSFLNSDGTALTNSSGVAEFTLVAESANGAGTIDVMIGDVTFEDPFSFEIWVPDSVKLGSFINGIFQEGVLTSSIATGQELSVGGTATITAELAFLDGDVYRPYTKTVDISFSTVCSTAAVDEVVATQNAIASTTYRADGCISGTDTVTATANINQSALTASVDLSLARPDVGSIAFVSAEPEHLALAGTSNPLFNTTSFVTFWVKDELGNSVPNELVNFSLSTSVGGISFSPLSAETNTEGKVRVQVSSGNVHTSVRVHATVNNSQITTVSSNLVISTGLPDQNSFSISAAPHNPEAWSVDGVPVTVTIRAGDHFNNPVPDGTTIAFTTEGGVIDPTCSTVNGSCSVEWRSQNPRPGNGRVTILATALGEEGFVDVNGSGRFESSIDQFVDESEAFLDNNENGLRDQNEEFLDYNEDSLFTDGNGKYNGTLCVSGCSNELIHIRNSIVLSMSGGSAQISINPSIVSNSVILLSDLVTVTIEVADFNGNSLPGGTTISLTPPENAEIEGESSFTISENTTQPAFFSFALRPDGDSESGTKSVLQVKVTSPNGTLTTESMVCKTP